jgi:hypothetical protein
MQQQKRPRLRFFDRNFRLYLTNFAFQDGACFKIYKVWVLALVCRAKC